MILVRMVFQAKFGTGGKLAATLSEASGPMGAELGTLRPWRVLTDLSGTFDTVVQEIEVESLAEWEKLRVKLFQLTAFRESMAVVADLVVSGHNELWTIEGQG